MIVKFLLLCCLGLAALLLNLAGCAAPLPHDHKSRQCQWDDVVELVLAGMASLDAAVTYVRQSARSHDAPPSAPISSAEVQEGAGA